MAINKRAYYTVNMYRAYWALLVRIAITVVNHQIQYDIEQRGPQHEPSGGGYNTGLSVSVLLQARRADTTASQK